MAIQGFTGSGFEFVGLTQVSSRILRISFTQAPLASDATGTHDGLNVSLYTLSGSLPILISSVSTVSTNDLSLDLILSAPLPSGSWILDLNPALQSQTGQNLSGALGTTFTVAASIAPTPISQGAHQPTIQDNLKKYLGPAFKGKGWDALTAAIATGDETNQSNIIALLPQLYLSTATGKYLEQLAADQGVDKPINIGISDDTFRQLAIQTTDEKLTTNAILAVLEVFFGPDSLRASVISNNTEPFSILPNDDLQMTIDGMQIQPIVFDSEDMSIPGVATAAEISIAIQRQLDMQGVAVDVSAESGHVRIRSRTRGPLSSVSVTGGIAQAKLKYPAQLFVVPADVQPSSISWTITPVDKGVEFQTTSSLELGSLQIGDYIIVTGQVFSPENRGTWTITEIDRRYVNGNLQQAITLSGNSGKVENVVQQSIDDILCFAPEVFVPQVLGSRAVAVVQTEPKQVQIQVPVTTQIVGRQAGTAAYIQTNDQIVADTLTQSGQTVTISTSNPHGLQVGQQILVEGAGPANGTHPISAVTNTTFTYTAPKSVNLTLSNVIVTPFRAQPKAINDAPGPYIIDPDLGFTVKSTDATLNQNLYEDVGAAVVLYQNATQPIPDTAGFMVLEFGHEDQSDVIPYFGQLNNQSLLLDFNYQFKSDYKASSSITLVERGPSETSSGSFYATDSAAGSSAAIDEIYKLLAAGIKANIKVIYPSTEGLDKSAPIWVWTGQA